MRKSRVTRYLTFLIAGALLADLGEPSWSPDGRKIAFSGAVRGTIGMSKPSIDIYVLNVDGSGLAKLTQDSGVNGSPTWSPDGKQIAFISDRDDLFKLFAHIVWWGGRSAAKCL